MFRKATGGPVGGAFETLDTIRNHSKYIQTQSYNSYFTDIIYNGFESRGQQTDVLPIDMTTFKPITTAAKSGAISLSAKSWPGLSGETFRGAKPPSSSSRIIVEDNQLAMSANPNPFNESFSVHYTLQEASEVTLTLMDVNARVIAQVLDQKTQLEGTYMNTIPTTNLALGIYFASYLQATTL